MRSGLLRTAHGALILQRSASIWKRRLDTRVVGVLGCVCGVWCVWRGLARGKTTVCRFTTSLCRSKTLLCMPAKRAYVFNMRAFCRYKRKRFEPTHADVLNLHTERREENDHSSSRFSLCTHGSDFHSFQRSEIFTETKRHKQNEGRPSSRQGTKTSNCNKIKGLRQAWLNSKGHVAHVPSSFCDTEALLASSNHFLAQHIQGCPSKSKPHHSSKQ